jgi:lysophospholipase L1-like esterase
LGWAEADGPHWPGYLGEILGASGDRTVVNAGVYGYTSFQGLRRLKQCLDQQPDLVLISFRINDASA